MSDGLHIVDKPSYKRKQPLSSMVTTQKGSHMLTQVDTYMSISHRFHSISLASGVSKSSVLLGKYICNDGQYYRNCEQCQEVGCATIVVCGGEASLAKGRTGVNRWFGHRKGSGFSRGFTSPLPYAFLKMAQALDCESLVS